MITAKFGSKQFKVTDKMIYTPSDFSMSESIDFEETEVSGKKPTTKVKGIKLQTVSFSVLLDARFVTISNEIKWWKDALRAKSSKALYYGSYKIGEFYLSQYDISDVTINKDGVYTKAKLNLSFTENPNPNTTPSSSNTVDSVKSSASDTSTTQVRKGSLVRPQSGTRMYPTWSAATNKSGAYEKAPQVDLTVTNVISEQGKVVAIQVVSKWMRVEDVKVIRY